MQRLLLLSHAGPWLHVSENWDKKKSPVYRQFPKYLLLASMNVKKQVYPRASGYCSTLNKINI